MIPYEILGLTEKPDALKFAFAVKTPNEKAYVFNRKDRNGNLEGQDWLWVDKHYPQNPSEYYVLTDEGCYSGTMKKYDFEWTEWNELSFSTDSPERYNVRGYAHNNGLYFNMVQYVNDYSVGSVNGDWKTNTHIETEIWQHNIGYGWDGTYFAFFMDGSYYVNNNRNIKNIINQVSISKAENGKYTYEISYEVFIEFDNNLENPQDGPYAYVKFMSHTPNESEDGYSNSVPITKDYDRVLWTDDCNSYGFNKECIYMSDKSYAATLDSIDVEVVDGNIKNINNKYITLSHDAVVMLNDISTNDNNSIKT